MKVFLVLENAFTTLQDPQTLDSMVLGIFFRRAGAEQSLRTHAADVHATRGIQLFIESGQAFDESGFLFLEIIERYVE